MLSPLILQFIITAPSHSLSSHGTTRSWIFVFTLSVDLTFGLFFLPAILWSFIIFLFLFSFLHYFALFPSSSFIFVCLTKARINAWHGVRDRYSSSDIIRAIKRRRMRCVGNVSSMGERRKAYTVLVGISGRSYGREWQDNLKLDLKEMRREGVCWIQLALVRTLINIRIA